MLTSAALRCGLCCGLNGAAGRAFGDEALREHAVQEAEEEAAVLDDVENDREDGHERGSDLPALQPRDEGEHNIQRVECHDCDDEGAAGASALLRRAGRGVVRAELVHEEKPEREQQDGHGHEVEDRCEREHVVRLGNALQKCDVDDGVRGGRRNDGAGCDLSLGFHEGSLL